MTIRSKMPVRLKKKWIEALRSGDYMQGRSALNERGRFCCLGVLCEAAGIKAVTIWNETKAYDGKTTCLSRELKKRFHINDAVENKLIDMNDNKMRSFKQIANYIARWL